MAKQQTLQTTPPVEQPRLTRQSYAQRRLWFLNRLQAQSTQHSILIRCRFAGHLDTRLLEQSLANLIRRHSILRTRYRESAQGSVQWVDENSSDKLRQWDLCTFGQEQREEKIQHILQGERSQPFDLEQGPVIRMHLLCFDPTQHELILNIHHIAFDGRSGEIMADEMVAGYTATPEPGHLPPLDWQYTDYAAREPTLLNGQKRDKLLSFWRRYLDAMPLQLAWPQAALKSSSHSDQLQRFRVTAEVVDRLEHFAESEHQSLFQTLLTLFSVWLHYLCKQERFLVGTDIHGRTLPQVKNLIGFFVNQLPIACDLTTEPTLADLFTRIRRSTRQAYGHHRLPFDMLVSTIAPQRKTNRAPLFQVKLNYQPSRVNNLSLGDAVIDTVEVEQNLAGFDLVIDLTHDKQGIAACLEYDTKLFSTEHMERAKTLWLRLLSHFESMLNLPLPALCQQLQSWEDEILCHQQQTQNNHNRAHLRTAARRSPLSAGQVNKEIL